MDAENGEDEKDNLKVHEELNQNKSK